MRIAQVAPLHESVPPPRYGGTERIVSYLTEELVRAGHDVTLFASGDSVTRARLVPCSPRALRGAGCRDTLAVHFRMLERVAAAARDFDVIHFHVDYMHFPMTRRLRFPHLTTLHGRLDYPEVASLYNEFREMPVVSISDAQREPVPALNWVGTVHHGLPADLYRFTPAPGGYLAFLGRLSPEKRCDRAIEIARRAGLPLKIAGKVDVNDRDYFRSVVEPLLGKADVEFVGEIGDERKSDFLGDALALLFPIDWPEPFGLVMVESFACGTPVVAWRNGSVPEVMAEGVTGYMVDTVDEAVQAVQRVASLDRRACRAVFDARFTVPRMLSGYLALYEAAAARSKRWTKSSA
ncbi:MAG TPA: glycosyltransferase family 4 protein [Planctomycetota bacterium]